MFEDKDKEFQIIGSLGSLHDQLFRPMLEDFHSFEVDGPFTHCTGCQKELLKSGASYLIEKIYQHNEIIFECALCFDCRKPMKKAYSPESIEAIQRFFKEKRTRWMDLSRCNFCGQPREELMAYKILAENVGQKMFYMNHPTTMCALCSQALSSVISLKTKEDLKEFTKDLFGPPGARQDLPQPDLSPVDVA